MERISLLFTFLFMITIGFGQSDYCGTDMPDEMMEWLKAYKRNHPHANQNRQRNTVYYIPLKIHIVGNDQGGGYYKTKDLLEALCTLNEQYQPVGFHFYIYEELDYINDQDLYEHTSFGVGNIVSQYNVPNVANIYFVQDPAGNCGYFSGWRDFIAVAKSCAAPDNATVAHELGHFFSLPHTFNGWENRNPSDAPRATDERASGSNCNSAGDYFCDTPADYLSIRWSCPYNDNKTDYVGDPYEVDGSLIMSYANDACQNKFSTEQIDAMVANLLGPRSGLLNHPDPDLSPISDAVTVYPADGATDINANCVKLMWHKSEGATHYSVLLTRYFNGNFYNIDTIVKDTTLYITDLEPGFNYRWKIKPFNAANTCVEYSDFSNFTTSSTSLITTTEAIKNASCNGSNDGQILLGANGGTSPYDFNWSNGSSMPSLGGLTAGTYEVTITDAGNRCQVKTFELTEPDLLTVNLSISENVLTADVSGGVPPYTYNWSTGSINQQIIFEPSGGYAVTVTDSVGCSKTRFYNMTGIDAVDIMDEVKIYPNPVSHSQQLTLDLYAAEPFEGMVEIYDYAGKRLSAVISTFKQGKNDQQIDIAHLQAGVYFVKIINGGSAINKKLVIF